MLKKTLTYNNIDGQPVTEDFYFNLTKAELMKLGFAGGDDLKERVKKIAEGEATPAEIIETFEKILRASYGVRTTDGKFRKSPDDFDTFVATEAYSDLLFETATSAEKSAEFVNAIIPQNLAEEVAKLQAAQEPQQKVQDVLVPDYQAEMSEEELRNALGVSNQDRKLEVTTNGYTDLEIWRMSGRDLAGQPKAVLMRAYQLKQNGYKPE